MEHDKVFSELLFIFPFLENTYTYCSEQLSFEVKYGISFVCIYIPCAYWSIANSFVRIPQLKSSKQHSEVLERELLVYNLFIYWTSSRYCTWQIFQSRQTFIFYRFFSYFKNNFEFLHTIRSNLLYKFKSIKKL